ncbi:MAG: transcriptional regulator [Micromonosporaceae bacterium]|nr:transcriptional regulator [Micromonosporaceae bacterium]
MDSTTVDEYATLNSHLWRVFVLSKSKSAALPLVRDQLEALTNALRHPHGPTMQQRLCALAGDLFQLTGEIYFDRDEYTSAAHCYTLAATACKEANEFDLWACAMTRHAFLGVYERQFGAAAPMLQLAAVLARRGDSHLSTRHWVAAVRAQTFAGLGDLDSCQAALDTAEQVTHIKGQPHNGGWLRFDGSRLAEERGACYAQLGQPDRAETALTEALSLNLSARRRGGVLTDLATLGAQRNDPEQIATHANPALEIAKQTGSGFIARKLHRLHIRLTPLLTDQRVRRIDRQIAALTSRTLTQ